MTHAGAMPTLFETMRVLQGTLPFLDRHVDRLVAACRASGLMPPPDYMRAEARGHGLRPPADRGLRVTWDGAKLVWDDRDLPTGEAMRVVVVHEPHPGYPLKTTDRGAFDRAAEAAVALGADEPILCTAAGSVAEGARFAVAWLTETALVVPDLALGILPSVGRTRLLELAVEWEWAVEEGEYDRAALAGRSVMLVNALRGVVPVSEVDGTATPADVRVTALARAFWPSA